MHATVRALLMLLLQAAQEVLAGKATVQLQGSVSKGTSTVFSADVDTFVRHTVWVLSIRSSEWTLQEQFCGILSATALNARGSSAGRPSGFMRCLWTGKSQCRCNNSLAAAQGYNLLQHTHSVAFVSKGMLKII